MVSVLAKKSMILMLALFMLAFNTYALPYTIPLNGKISLNLNIYDASVQLDANNKGSFITYLFQDGQLIGDGVLGIENLAQDFDGDVNLLSDGQPVGTAHITSSNFVANVKNIVFDSSSDASLCVPNENKLLCTFSLSMQQGQTYVGNIYYSVNLNDFSSESINFLINTQNANIGSGTMNFAGLSVDYPNLDKISEYFYGEVKNTYGKPISAQLEVEYSEESSFYEIKNGKYGEPDPIRVYAPTNTKVSFYVNKQLSAEKIISEDGKSNRLDLTYNVDDDDGGFPDSDRDGIPDEKDECPDSKSLPVDRNGCDCKQKCGDSAKCIVEDSKLLCEKECPANTQNAINLENECNDCNICGCQDGFACRSDGNCEMTVQLVGKKCKRNNFIYDLNDIDCKQRGDDWIKEKLKDYVELKVSGFPIISYFINKAVQNKLKKATICIKTEDIGCPSPKAKCPGETELTDDDKNKAAELVKQKIKNQIKLPGFVDFFVDIDVKVDLSNYRLDIPYECASITINSKDSCKSLIKNGATETKADVLFIGDGFCNEEELKDKVLEMIDYDAKNLNTKKSGFFSEEPYKSNRVKFNVWYMDSKGKINYQKDELIVDLGDQPVYKDIFNLSTNCPWYDYVVLISANNDYTPNCVGTGPCRIPVIEEDYPGRLLLHEFGGHGIGLLTDEYYNPVERRDNQNVYNSFYSAFVTGPNCKPNQNEAEKAWGDLIDNDRIDYFKECGGPCDQECANYIRPTYNSIMRRNRVICDKNGEEYQCNKGPPFDGFYAVNEMEILKELNKYS